MIVTVTLNPAVDISYPLDQLKIDAGNRVSEVSKTAGGKGLNVARVVGLLGGDVAASGFIGGSLGDFIRSEIREQGIADRFVGIAGETRNCIAILHEGNQTEILEAGPEISSSERDDFLAKFDEFLDEASVVTLNGSLPAGLDGDFYGELIKRAKSAGKPVFLDTGGSVTKEILSGEAKPFLIKPNESEFAELVGVSSLSKAEIVKELDGSIFDGVQWVVVSLGKDGALVKCGEDLYEASIPDIEAVNPVGSGDSVIAGLALALERGYSTERMISYGLTMGVLNALEEKTGYIQVDRVDEIQREVIIRKI